MWHRLMWRHPPSPSPRPSPSVSTRIVMLTDAYCPSPGQSCSPSLAALPLNVPDDECTSRASNKAPRRRASWLALLRVLTLRARRVVHASHLLQIGLGAT